MELRNKAEELCYAGQIGMGDLPAFAFKNGKINAGVFEIKPVVLQKMEIQQTSPDQYQYKGSDVVFEIIPPSPHRVYGALPPDWKK